MSGISTQRARPVNLHVDLGTRSYPILIGEGLLDDAGSWLPLLPSGKLLIVTNDVVAPLYLDRVRAAVARESVVLVLPDGESHKTLAQCNSVYACMADNGMGRDATIVALGGGVIGDLAGFAAACWMRGVRFVQIPTTLLSMVDSSVGGKTGVNLPQGKNLVGAFHQPSLVLADTSTLSTLPDRELRSGFAEIVKYGAIRDASFLDWLERHADALLARETASMIAAIERSCLHKAEVVARDERESGERALLNFGHTFAHALEHVAGYGTLLHGDAVGIGMVLAAGLSVRMGFASSEDAVRLAKLLERLRVPTILPPGIDSSDLIAAMQLDKKSVAGVLRFVLWRGPGDAFLCEAVPIDALRETISKASAEGQSR